MKKIIGNGAGNTILKGAINPGSNLEIESASIDDVDVYGGRLYIQGGVVLNGVANTSGTAAVAFTGGTIGTGGFVFGTTYVSSATLDTNVTMTVGTSATYLGTGGAMFDFNAHNFFVTSACYFSASGITFSGGSSLTAGILRTSGGSVYLSNCEFVSNYCSGNGILYQQVNAAYMEVESCVFRDNYTLGNGNDAFYYHANNGSARITDCLITGTTARTLPCLYIANGGVIEITGCTFTDNVVRINGALNQVINTSSLFSSCVFSRNSSTERNHNGRVFIFGGTPSLIDCYVEDVISSPIATVYTSATCVLTISGGTCSTIQNLGTTNLAGTIAIDYLSSGTVNITSGTSITLTSNMSCTAIHVDGECEVNGAQVSSGTYTNIDSEGNAT